MIEIIRIQVRRDTSSGWYTKNPILASGEFGYETDTGKLKVGDGVKTWLQLDYVTADVVHLSANDFAGTGSFDDPITIRR